MSKKKQPKRPKHIPLRTCIVCGQKTDKRLLIRIVNTADEGLIIDLTGKRNGRGAYVCQQPSCWDKIVNTSLLANALKTEITAEEKAEINKHRPMITVA
jgi:predicted RNA-binding protein YlxR (DUF448 family)